MAYRLRTQQIIIDLPTTSSEPWISLTVQRVELDMDGNEINVVDRYGHIYRRLSQVAVDVFPYFEAVPGVPSGSISVFAISDAIKSVALGWIVEEYGGRLVNDMVVFD